MTPLPDHSSKLPQVGTTIFATMSALAAKHEAINLSQGFPDFEVDEQLRALVSKYMKAGCNQYAPMAGVLELRRAIAEKVERLHGRAYDLESEITVTAGATQAIYTAITALVKEDDEVIIFTPAYDCYAPPVLLCGAKPVYVQLRSPDFKVNWAEVRKVVTRKTKMIIINSPHNPSGVVWSDEDMRELEKLVLDSNAFVLSDEVYEHIVFDGHQHHSASAYPELSARSMVVASFGKTFHATGWKLGYIAAPEPLMHEFRKVHQYVVFAVNTPMQYALAEYMQDASKYTHLSYWYQQKRDAFLQAIAPSKWTWKPTMGTYFQLLNYSKVSRKNEVAYAEQLTVKHKLAAIPISVFYHQPVEQFTLRFCFAKSDETLNKAAEILNSL